jgi:hypothetical protein
MGPTANSPLPPSLYARTTSHPPHPLRTARRCNIPRRLFPRSCPTRRRAPRPPSPRQPAGRSGSCHHPVSDRDESPPPPAPSSAEPPGRHSVRRWRMGWSRSRSRSGRRGRRAGRRVLRHGVCGRDDRHAERHRDRRQREGGGAEAGTANEAATAPPLTASLLCPATKFPVLLRAAGLLFCLPLCVLELHTMPGCRRIRGSSREEGAQRCRRERGGAPRRRRGGGERHTSQVGRRGVLRVGAVGRKEACDTGGEKERGGVGGCGAEERVRGMSVKISSPKKNEVTLKTWYVFFLPAPARPPPRRPPSARKSTAHLPPRPPRRKSRPHPSRILRIVNSSASASADSLHLLLPPAPATVLPRRRDDDGIPRSLLLPPPPSNRITIDIDAVSTTPDPSTPSPPHRIATIAIDASSDVSPRAGTAPSPPIRSYRHRRPSPNLLPSARIDAIARRQTR